MDSRVLSQVEMCHILVMVRSLALQVLQVVCCNELFLFRFLGISAHTVTLAPSFFKSHLLFWCLITSDDLQIFISGPRYAFAFRFQVQAYEISIPKFWMHLSLQCPINLEFSLHDFGHVAACWPPFVMSIFAQVEAGDAHWRPSSVATCGQEPGISAAWPQWHWGSS